MYTGERTIFDLCGKKRTERIMTPCWLKSTQTDRKRIHVAGLGDVGGTLLIGLALTGGEDVEEIGIYDLNEKQCRRWEIELGQVQDPLGRRRIPSVRTLREAELFACDVFVFCVALAVPAVGEETGDVRMAQFAANRKIVEQYARRASEAGFRGLFAVVSDPVDLLCKAAYLAGNEAGNGLLPEQIQGCGLGVMNARASYYAKREPEFVRFLSEGRVFGPHGRDLVVADSIRNYDEERSLRLTNLTIQANLTVRDLGFKPYIAPALSSAALTILRILEGEWNYSANYLGDVYFGGRNRTTREGIEWELLPLPLPLFKRLQRAYENLEMIL